MEEARSNTTILNYYNRQSDNTEYVHYESAGKQQLTNGVKSWEPTEERMKQLTKVEKIDEKAMIERLTEHQPYNSLIQCLQEKQEINIGLSEEQLSDLNMYLLMSTQHRKGELKVWQELDREMTEQGEKKFPNAKSNADFWKDMITSLERIQAKVDVRRESNDVVLNGQELSDLKTYLLMSTQYRKGELKAWQELDKEVTEQGEKKYPNAKSNADFWKDMITSLDRIQVKLENADFYHDLGMSKKEFINAAVNDVSSSVNHLYEAGYPVDDINKMADNSVHLQELKNIEDMAAVSKLKVAVKDLQMAGYKTNDIKKTISDSFETAKNKKLKKNDISFEKRQEQKKANKRKGKSR